CRAARQRPVAFGTPHRRRGEDAPGLFRRGLRPHRNAGDPSGRSHSRRPGRTAHCRGIRLDCCGSSGLGRAPGCARQHSSPCGRNAVTAADPVTMEVVRNALSSIADEMALVVMRTAYSTIVRDSMDYSTGLCDRDGRVVAHGLTMALHLGSFPDAMRCLTADYGGRMEEGDVFVWNDPYGAGGMHLPDVYIVQPIFEAGALEGYAATLVHQIDVGGIAPGSTAVYATEVFQEGLRIPIVKMYEHGRPNETFFKLMEKNTRIPETLAGDMRAQMAACRTAEKAYRGLVAKYGSENFRGLIADLHDHAERMMRAEIAALPDGAWSFTDYIDGLGDEPE